jgi:N-methylhydantoinase A
MSVHIGVDVGGTFTDFAVHLSDGRGLVLHKVPSDPERPDRAIVRGLAEIVDRHGIAPGRIVSLAHGTTVGTNALIQRRVGKVALVTSRGFRDLLEIGRQVRPKVYDIHTDFPEPLVPRRLRFEVAERMRADGIVHVALDEAEVAALAPRLRAEAVDCVVVCFLHSHVYPAHERRAVAVLRRELGNAVPVLASSTVYPEFREYERFSTATLNAALLTVMNAYLDRFTAETRGLGVRHEPLVSQSAGGLMSAGMSRDFPIRSALSGPAAGVIGAAYRAGIAGFPDLITLDVGGTSADVSLLAGGKPALVHSRRLAGFPLRLPTLDVNAVGAGGGSIAWIDKDGLLKVGPESAGALPGPACYGLGGAQATVTDANVLLGRLPADALLDGRMPIQRTLAEAAVGRLAQTLSLGLTETALGIVQVASAVIVKAIRTISIERGHDPAGFALFAFGGAGPLHATEVARQLGIRRLVIPPNPGILCAEGLLVSDLTADFVHARLASVDAKVAEVLNAGTAVLGRQAEDWFAAEEVAPARRQQAWQADMRYRGQNFELSVPITGEAFDAGAVAALRRAFEAAHEQAYGFAQPDEPMELVSLRLKVTGVMDKPALPEWPGGAPTAPAGAREVLFEGDTWRRAALFRREALTAGQEFSGPAIVEQMDSTVPIFPGDRCRVDRWGNLVVEVAVPTGPV